MVGNVRRGSLAEDPRADLYYPFERAMIPTITLFIRVAGKDPMAALPAVRAAVQHVEPHAVLYHARTMKHIAEESAAVTRLATRLLAGFAAIALLLAGVGVHGVMSYRVRRRTRELGTRLALGASPTHIIRLIMLQGAAIAAVGLTAGTAAALALTGTLSSVLYDVSPSDPLTLAATAALLALATLVAGYLPARRAARIDPVAALATE